MSGPNATVSCTVCGHIADESRTGDCRSCGYCTRKPLTETQEALADHLRHHDAYGPEELARALTARFVIVERGDGVTLDAASLLERARARR